MISFVYAPFAVLDAGLRVTTTVTKSRAITECSTTTNATTTNATTTTPSPATTSSEWWCAYLACEDAQKRRAILEAAIKRRLGAGSSTGPREQKLSRHAWDLSWQLAQLEDPLEALEQLEVGLEAVARQLEAPLSPREEALEGFLRSGEVHAHREAWQRRVAEERLIRWLMTEEDAPLGERIEIEVAWLIAAQADNFPSVAFELRISTDDRPYEPQSREQLAQLLADARAKRRALTGPQRRLVEWVATKGCAATAGGTTIPVSSISDWVALFAKDAPVRWEDGTPVQVDLRPVTMTLLREDQGRARWALALEPATARAPARTAPLAPDPCVHIVRELEGPAGEAQLWVRDGSVLRPLDPLGMPHDLVRLLAKSPELPLERLKDQVAGAVLARRMVSAISGAQARAHGPGASRGADGVAATAAPGAEPADPPGDGIVQTIGVRPYVELRLANEVTYTVLARARAQDGSEFVRTHQGAWVPASAVQSRDAATRDEPLEPLDARAAEAAPAPEPVSPEARAQALAVIPRPADVAQVDAWLGRLIPKDAERITSRCGVPAFAWRAGGAADLRLVRQWLARPSGVDYFGDGSFTNVVKVQPAPRLKVATREAGIDWLEVSVDLEDELATLSLADIADALEQSEDEILMLGGARLYQRADLERYLHEAEALLEVGIVPKSGWQRVHVKALAGEPGKVIAQVRTADGRIRAVLESARRNENDPIPTAPVHPSAASFLRPYQRAGVDFLTHATHAFGGALLADDMGLGKTLQTLSTLTALRNLSDVRGLPSLVICPASVAHNWRREAQKFVPDLKVVVCEGSARKQVLSRLSEYDLVIENFALVRRDVEALSRQEFLLIAIDEAQAIKNPGADITQSVKQLNARHRIALTGTPIENRLTDLWSIADFAVPGYLGSLPAFDRLVRDQESEVVTKMLRARMRPLILRRLKRDVAPELPDRIEERLDCEMTDGQKKAYLAEVKRTRLILEGVTDPSDLSGQKRVQMLAALTRLRQICCEPVLVDLPDRSSGKIEELMHLLPELLESGHKVLLFSQFVRMLHILEARLNERDIPNRILTGTTPDRMAVVDAFEKDPTPSVFLLSLRAAGTGLNLTSASHVVLFDPWWSPALEAQAIDRSHRIGQTKTVVAIRMVTKGTIEERILDLQDRKRDLSRDVLEPGGGGIDRTLTADDFDYLLRSEDEPSEPPGWCAAER